MNQQLYYLVISGTNTRITNRDDSVLMVRENDIHYFTQKWEGIAKEDITPMTLKQYHDEFGGRPPVEVSESD